MDHWRRGHKQMCKKIHRGGNAEQYHADKKYKEAVAVAVEACAADVPLAPLEIVASGITISCMASNTSRGVVGQWGGAGGAVCEDHLAFCGELLGLSG